MKHALVREPAGEDGGLCKMMYAFEGIQVQAARCRVSMPVGHIEDGK